MGGFLTMPLLAAIWHLARLAKPAERGDYHLTSYITNCFGIGFFFVLFTIAVFVGWITKFVWAFAFAVVLPFPMMLLIEISEDPTSHNMLPLEPVFVWFPIFALLLGGLYVGRYARKRAR